jgi:hypothetical protein
MGRALTMAQSVYESDSIGLTESALLASAVRSLMECADEDAVFDVLVEFASALVPDAIIVVNGASEDGTCLVTRDVVGMSGGAIATVARIMGIDFVGHAWEISEVYRAE